MLRELGGVCQAAPLLLIVLLIGKAKSGISDICKNRETFVVKYTFVVVKLQVVFFVVVV